MGLVGTGHKAQGAWPMVILLYLSDSLFSHNKLAVAQTRVSWGSRPCVTGVGTVATAGGASWLMAHVHQHAVGVSNQRLSAPLGCRW